MAAAAACVVAVVVWPWWQRRSGWVPRNRQPSHRFSKSRNRRPYLAPWALLRACGEADTDGTLPIKPALGCHFLPFPPLCHPGIEWDDATRGKHDGSVVSAAGDTVRYFTCPAGAGSFLKASLVDTGVSFMTAMRLKYEAEGGEGGGTFEMENGRSMEVELVGDDKIRCVVSRSAGLVVG